MTTATATELTFGVEFEVTIHASAIQAHGIRIGGYHNGAPISELPLGWNAQRDCSIGTTNPGHIGVEIVSPVLKGADGIRQVQQVCAWLEAIGAKVNRSTGFHVHVGWDADDKAKKRLARLVSNHEPALYAATGTHAREHNGFCGSVRNNVYYRESIEGDGQYTRRNRYHVLNLTNTRTVEFRVFAGTTSAVKAIGYIRMCLAIVEKALSTRTVAKWVRKDVPEGSQMKKAGPGQTEMARFFYTFGWTKGMASKTYGEVEADGAPGLADVKKELMRLAAKYDAGQ